MEFTGERYVSSLQSAQISYEHWHRYLFASFFVQGKSVLDIASGEGYGSSFLAHKAHQVLGVDISAETVSWAKKAYPLENLKFIEGSCSNIPVSGQHVFDVVVSFETIEHITEVEQGLFLQEIKRLLKPDGILIISTPNKFLYSDKDNYKNEFHIKEFYREEFEKFLSHYFNHVAIGGQKIYTSSWIWPLKNTKLPFIDGNIDLIENQFIPVDEQKEDLYNIALCSNKKHVEIPYSGLTDLSQQIQKEFFDSVGNLLGSKDSEIREKENVVEEREKHISILLNSIAEKEEQFQHSLERIHEKESQINEINLKLRDVENAMREREITINEITRVIVEREHLIREKEGIIIEKNNLILEKEDVINEKCNVICEKENLIKNSEQRIDDLYHSLSWKITSPLRFLFTQLFKFYYFFCPYGSKRWFFSKALVTLFIQPHKILPKVTIRNLRTLKTALSIEDPLKTDKNFNKYISGEVKQTKIEIIIPSIVINEVIPGITVPVFLSPEMVFIIASFESIDQLSASILSIIEHTKIPYKVCLMTEDKHQIDDLNNIDGLDVITREALSQYVSGLSSLKYISFINGSIVIDDDTVNQAINLLKSEVSVGSVIPMVISNDQKLDSAGIIIWNDGSTYNYGYGEDPGLPEYEYVKEVDSGNYFFIAKLDGFRHWIETSELSYTSWYYRLHDFSMFLRSSGSMVKYQPLSKIGLISSKVERFETRENDRVLFIQKWNEALRTQHLSNGPGNVFLSRERSQGKKIMLMIDHYVPHFDKDAGSRSMKSIIDLYRQLGIELKFLGDNFFPHQPYTKVLQQEGIEVLCGCYYRDNWEKWIEQNGRHFSYVFLSRPHIAIKHITLCRKFTESKLIFYGHDLHYLRELREFEISGDKKRKKASEDFKKLEEEVFNLVDVIYYPSQAEIEIIKKDFFIEKPLKAILLFSYRTFPLKRYDFNTRKNIMFVGGFGHPPNVDGVLWFLKSIYPKVVDLHPEMKFFIIGSNPPDVILNLASENIIVTGYVSDEELLDYYQQCRMVVAPLRYGAGMKGKILESFYNYVPVITTSIGAEGLQETKDILIISDQEDEFARLVATAYSDKLLLETLSEHAYSFLKKFYSNEKALALLNQDL